MLNQCRLPCPPSELTSVHLSASTSHSDDVVLPTKPLYVHWTQSRCSGDSERVSPTPWYRCASPWTPWVSSASLGASRSSSRPGLGPSCTVDTGEADKRLSEGQSWLQSAVLCEDRSVSMWPGKSTSVLSRHSTQKTVGQRLIDSKNCFL